MTFKKLMCLLLGHKFMLENAVFRGIPYADGTTLEFVDYDARGRCERCGKLRMDYGRARVAIWGAPCGPVLASTPCWISESRENRGRLIKRIKEWLSDNG